MIYMNLNGKGPLMEMLASYSDILDETKVYELICRYGDRFYIRYCLDDGFIAELPVAEIPTGVDVVALIKQKPEEMIRIVNTFQKKVHWTEYSFVQSTITDHLLYSGDMPMKQASKILKRLNGQEDILQEMYNMIIEGKPGIRRVKAAGYTAAQIMERTQLNLIGTYLFLISLRENPEKAKPELEEIMLEQS